MCGINIEGLRSQLTRHHCTPIPAGGPSNSGWTTNSVQIEVRSNLLDNGADAVNGSGNIAIRTRQDDAAIIVAVDDHGPGLPEEVAGRISDAFVTSKPPGQGTGLGLSIARRIITERHAGQIEVDSAPGRTALRVSLPIRR